MPPGRKHPAHPPVSALGGLLTARAGPSMHTQEGQINRCTGHKGPFCFWDPHLWAQRAGLQPSGLVPSLPRSLGGCSPKTLLGQRVSTGSECGWGGGDRDNLPTGTLSTLSATLGGNRTAFQCPPLVPETELPTPMGDRGAFCCNGETLVGSSMAPGKTTGKTKS